MKKLVPAFAIVVVLACAIAGCNSTGLPGGATDSDGGSDGRDGGGTGSSDAASDPDGGPGEKDGGSDSGTGEDAGSTEDVGTDAGGGTIAIYLAGDATPKVYQDGFAGQTPADYHIALSRYYIQTSMDDPSPVLCFDHGAAPVEADLAGDNLMGVCRTQSLPSAVYTHGHVKVDWVRFSVNGTLHSSGYSLPGTFTFFRAYSDVSYDGHAYAAGEGKVKFAGTTTTEVPATFPPIPPIPGLRMETIAGEFWMTFPYSRPLTVLQGDTGQRWARFHWEIFEGFRWEDRQAAAYTDGTWDVNAVQADTERVVNPGATGYHVTASTD